MIDIELIRGRILARIPGAEVVLVPNGAPLSVGSLWVGSETIVAVARLLKEEPDLAFDYCSNVTGVDWLDRVEKAKVKVVVDGVSQEVEQTRRIPGYLEVVYHLYSMGLRHGPLVLRCRTRDRERGTVLPSLTPIWRSCELQEREVYDLYGVCFEGHPDLRRILMWEGFQDHPMRKDYRDPDDYEYEPTPHDRVLERALAQRKSNSNS